MGRFTATEQGKAWEIDEYNAADFDPEIIREMVREANDSPDLAFRRDVLDSAVVLGGMLLGTVASQEIHKPGVVMAIVDGAWQQLPQSVLEEQRRFPNAVYACKVPVIAMVTALLGDLNVPDQRQALNMPPLSGNDTSKFRWAYGPSNSGRYLLLMTEPTRGVLLNNPEVTGSVDIVTSGAPWTESPAPGCYETNGPATTIASLTVTAGMLSESDLGPLA